MLTTKQLFVITVLAPIFLTSCTLKIPEQNSVEKQKDLGSIHVTVFPPVDFEKYRNDLSPKFTLTGNDSLEKVAPYTSFHASSQFAGGAAGVSVGLPTMTSTETTTNSTEGVVATNITEDKKVKSAGTVPENSGTPDPTQRVLSPAAPTGTLSRLDPMTQYWSAAALYQEVQLLNRFIKDIDPGNDYHAYVTRLQISQIPYVRRAPYDSIVDLSFFVEEVERETSSNLPIILPMLVTDNLEASHDSYHAETVRSLAVALQGMAGQVGFSIGGQAYKQAIEQILGRDLNSLMTVGRLHDNILRVRLGAMQQAAGLYAVVPHTQTVSVLVLVKKEQVQNNGSKLIVRVTQSGEKQPLQKNIRHHCKQLSRNILKSLTFLLKNLVTRS